MLLFPTYPPIITHKSNSQLLLICALLLYSSSLNTSHVSHGRIAVGEIFLLFLLLPSARFVVCVSSFPSASEDKSPGAIRHESFVLCCLDCCCCCTAV
uniref:Uncharacterized protein n=1 Tax=Daphnia magna TaxID=35525 RepID=A0A0P6IPR8_9CRUS